MADETVHDEQDETVEDTTHEEDTPSSDVEQSENQDETVPRSQYDAIKQRLDKMEREAGERERKRRKAEQDTKRAEGRWQEVAQEAEGERDKAFQERDNAMRELQDFKREVRVTKIASGLNFIDVEDAVYWLQRNDPDSMDDDDLARAALTRLAKLKPRWVDTQRRSGAPVNGRNGTSEDPAKAFNTFVAGILEPGAAQAS